MRGGATLLVAILLAFAGLLVMTGIIVGCEPEGPDPWPRDGQQGYHIGAAVRGVNVYRLDDEERGVSCYVLMPGLGLSCVRTDP